MKKKILLAVSVLLVLCLALPMGAAALGADGTGTIPPLPPQAQEMIAYWGAENVSVSYEDGYLSVDVLPKALLTLHALRADYVTPTIFASVTRFYGLYELYPVAIYHTELVVYSIGTATYYGVLRMNHIGQNLHTQIVDVRYEGDIPLQHL